MKSVNVWWKNISYDWTNLNEQGVKCIHSEYDGFRHLWTEEKYTVKKLQQYFDVRGKKISLMNCLVMN